MFDFLKGGKAYIKLVLDRPVQPYFFGENVHATVTVTGEKDLKIQQARIELRYREEYEYRYEKREQDSQGKTTTTTDKSWTTDDKEVKREVFLGETTVKAGSKQTFEFDLPIPMNAAPTIQGGRIVRIQWLVKAILDRRLASDTEDKVEIPVFTVPPDRMNQPDTYGFSNEPSDAELALSLPTLECVLGDALTGELQVRPQKEFDVTEIRVELVRREYVPRDLGNEQVETIPVRVAGPTKLKPEENLTFPFRLMIPSPSPVTLRTPNSSINWVLKGVLARRLRGDTFVEQEVFVYNVRR